MKKIILVLFACMLMSACRKSLPEVPWENFERYHIDEKLSKKGPLNNYRITFWKADKDTYHPEVVADYAARYGWKLKGEYMIADSMLTAISDTAYRKIFKIKATEWPHWLKSGYWMYKFAPPTSFPKKDYNNFGYFTCVSPDKSQMCVYNIMW